jgi:hypothetical protein
MNVLRGSQHSREPVLPRAINAIRTVRGGDQFEDDISIIEFAFDAGTYSPCDSAPEESKTSRIGTCNIAVISRRYGL